MLLGLLFIIAPATASCFISSHPSPQRNFQTLFVSRKLGDGQFAHDDEDPSIHQLESSRLRCVKDKILELSRRTDRGFVASSLDQKRARELIFDLAKYNPTTEPAIPYYSDGSHENDVVGPSLAGKWTLVYTDAPDITGLNIPQQQQGFSIPPTAKLGRVGQECVPPFIQNVIEWERPDWASNLPFVSGPARVLQKVLTEAVASPTKPKLVQLKLVGFDLVFDIRNANLPRSISAFLEKPTQTRFPLALPFGEFEVLFLDCDMRAVRTGQNFLAVNIREPTEWF